MGPGSLAAVLAFYDWGNTRERNRGHCYRFLASRSCFKNGRLAVEATGPRETSYLWHSHNMRRKPNKAPEPTTFAVTSRAIVRLIEMKQQNPDRDAARAAPAKAV